MSKGKTLLQRAATDWKQAGKPRGDIIVKGPSTADLIRAELAPVADTIRAQQEQLDDAAGNAFRMAAELAGKLNLSSQEQRVFEALRETSGNELAAAQSLAARYPKGRGLSRSNVQRIRERIEQRMAPHYKHPRTFWAKSHPMAGKNPGTLPAR